MYRSDIAAGYPDQGPRTYITVEVVDMQVVDANVPQDHLSNDDHQRTDAQCDAQRLAAAAYRLLGTMATENVTAVKRHHHDDTKTQCTWKRETDRRT